MKLKLMPAAIRSGIKKIVLIMKLITILLLIALSEVHATSFAQNVSINERNITIKNVLQLIEKQSNYQVVMFDKLDILNTTKLNLNVKDKKINEVLDYCLSGLPISYAIIQQTIVLKQVTSNVAPLQEAPRQLKVTGKVSDENNQPLPGVTVKLKGTNIGAVTDQSGQYSLTVADKGEQLIFSFIGYVTQEVAINNRSTINVQLKEDNQSLGDVIVVGYGTQKKRDVTGAITSVSGEKIKDMPVTNAVQALQGQVAGVDIQRSSGKPGDGVTVRVRGNRSITATNDPLYIIDGIPSATSINIFSPSDVASIEVLKDASATAIYGSRGANGVILITTKRGKSGKISVSYDPFFGKTEAIGRIKVFNAPEYAQFHIDGGRALQDWERAALIEGVDTDWGKLPFKPNGGFIQNHNLSVAGGNESTKIYISGNYFKETGTTYKSDYSRYNFRINLDQKITDKIKIGSAVVLSHSITNAGVFPYWSSLEYNPLAKPRNPDGSINFTADFDALKRNPLTEIEGASVDEGKYNTVVGNLFGEYDIIKNLKYRVNFGFNADQYRKGAFNSTIRNNLGLTTASWENRAVADYTVENILTYKLDLGKHSLDFTGLYSFENNTNENMQLAVQGLPYEQQSFYNLGSADNITNRSSNLVKWGLQSFMGRAHYSYKNRYLATLTMRSDGSSRLADGHKWGYFPSLALAWRLIDEPFMKGQGVFDDIKIRASYGRIGSQGINPYQTQGTLGRVVYAWDETPAYGYRPANIANPNLRWEYTATTNFGLDFGLFNQLLSGSIEVYQQNTSDLLLSRQLPTSTGFSSIIQNVGKTRNTGAELTLLVSPLRKENKFNWNFNLNLNTNKEEIKALNNGLTADIGNKWFVGHPISVYYDYEKTGIWQNDELAEAAKYGQKPGQIKVKDQNGDGKINDQDRVILGSPRPKWGGGIVNNFAYKGFDFSFYIYARQGQMLFNNIAESIDRMEARSNNLRVDYWSPDHPTNDHPAPTNGAGALYLSTMRYFNGSFIRLQNATLGYRFRPELVQKLRLSGLRVYASGQNLALLSKQHTPSISYWQDLPSNGTLSIGSVPLSRVFQIGLSIQP